MSESLIMVAVRDPEHADDLVKLGCQMAKGTGAEVAAISVVEIAPALPLDADAEVLDKSGKQALVRAAEVAATDCGTKIRTMLVRARDAGPALVDEAKEHHADVLIVGYHGRLGIGQILLGSCVQHLAAHAPCRVILQIDPASEPEARKAAG
jgi:nucleotide-binding universal stress UspA family protein